MKNAFKFFYLFNVLFKIIFSCDSHLLQVSPVEVSVVEYETLKSISDLLKTESKLHFLWTSSLCMETEEVTLAELLRSSNLIDDVSRYQVRNV